VHYRQDRGENHSRSRSAYTTSLLPLRYRLSCASPYLRHLITSRPELPHLITSLGIIDMRRRYKFSPRILPEIKIEVSLEAGRWIVLHGKRELRLPPDYQPWNLSLQSSKMVA
jgi:hypothetical protein